MWHHALTITSVCVTDICFHYSFYNYYEYYHSYYTCRDSPLVHLTMSSSDTHSSAPTYRISELAYCITSKLCF